MHICVTEFTVYNVYGSAVKPRPTGRGSSRRGRPRGSRSRTPGVGRSFPTASPSTSSGPSTSAGVHTAGKNYILFVIYRNKITPT